MRSPHARPRPWRTRWAFWAVCWATAFALGWVTTLTLLRALQPEHPPVRQEAARVELPPRPERMPTTQAGP